MAETTSGFSHRQRLQCVFALPCRPTHLFGHAGTSELRPLDMF
ncbi:hypothetical protein [Streptomyces sp. NPDC047718]